MTRQPGSSDRLFVGRDTGAPQLVPFAGETWSVILQRSMSDYHGNMDGKKFRQCASALSIASSARLLYWSCAACRLPLPCSWGRYNLARGIDAIIDRVPAHRKTAPVLVHPARGSAFLCCCCRRASWRVA